MSAGAHAREQRLYRALTAGADTELMREWGLIVLLQPLLLSPSAKVRKNASGALRSLGALDEIGSGAQS